jgi:DNA-binding CsgD family transcriptional regulator
MRAFSPRECEIAALIVMGWPASKIGTRLGIAEKTVESHRANLYRKVHVNGIAGLVQFIMANPDALKHPGPQKRTSSPLPGGLRFEGLARPGLSS